MHTRHNSFCRLALGLSLLAGCDGSGSASDAGTGANRDSGSGHGAMTADGGLASDAAAAAGGGAGGAHDSGAAGSGGGQSDGGAAGGCTVTGQDLLTSQDHELSGLSFGSGRLAFLSSDLSLAAAPTIDTIKLDGTGRTTLHSPTGQRRVHALIAHGDKLYFLEENEDPSIPMLELFSIPITGGTASRLGAATFSGARFVGADDTSLYLVSSTDQPVGDIFQRVDASTGAVEKAATLTGVSTVFYPQLSGDSVFFVTGMTGANAGMLGAYSFPKSGANVTPTLLWTANDSSDSCMLSLGGLAATPTKLVCGMFGVEARTRTGTGAMALVMKDLTMRRDVAVASDAENVYLMTPPQGVIGTAVGSLSRIASTGGAVTPIACDVHTLENHLADGTFPIQNEYEVLVGGDQLYWIEKRTTQTNSTWVVRHAAN